MKLLSENKKILAPDFFAFPGPIDLAGKRGLVRRYSYPDWEESHFLELQRHGPVIRGFHGSLDDLAFERACFVVIRRHRSPELHMQNFTAGAPSHTESTEKK